MVNSQGFIKDAREIYFKYLANNAITSNPIGIALDQNTGKGRVLFSYATLLPTEKFLKFKYIIPKTHHRRSGN